MQYTPFAPLPDTSTFVRLPFTEQQPVLLPLDDKVGRQRSRIGEPLSCTTDPLSLLPKTIKIQDTGKDALEQFTFLVIKFLLNREKKEIDYQNPSDEVLVFLKRTLKRKKNYHRKIILAGYYSGVSNYQLDVSWKEFVDKKFKKCLKNPLRRIFEKFHSQGHCDAVLDSEKSQNSNSAATPQISGGKADLSVGAKRRRPDSFEELDPHSKKSTLSPNDFDEFILHLPEELRNDNAAEWHSGYVAEDLSIGAISETLQVKWGGDFANDEMRFLTVKHYLSRINPEFKNKLTYEDCEKVAAIVCRKPDFILNLMRASKIKRVQNYHFDKSWQDFISRMNAIDPFSSVLSHLECKGTCDILMDEV